MHASASGTRDGFRGRQLILLGVLDGDTIISTRKGAGVGGFVLVLIGGLGTARRGVDASSHANAGAIIVGGNQGGSADGACNDASLATSNAKSGGGSAVERHLGWFWMGTGKNVFVGGCEWKENENNGW